MRGLLWRTKGRLATARMVARWPGAHLESTTVSGLAVRRNVGLGSPTNSQPGRLRYVAQASGLRVLAASSRQFWWYFQDAPEVLRQPDSAHPELRCHLMRAGQVRSRVDPPPFGC